MNGEPLSPGWGRPAVSTYFHYYDGAAPGGEPALSICGMARFSGPIVAEIRRWETDPSICEVCRDARRALARGRPARNAAMRTVAIVPVGLPELVRAHFRAASANEAGGPPFYQTVARFRSLGVTRQFLAALLRFDRERAELRAGRPLRWGEIRLDALRETEGAKRVRVVREPAENGDDDDRKTCRDMPDVII
jgi:hypothetical protein